MQINESKSEFILFTRRWILPELSQMSMNGCQIERSSSIKYLGITMQHNIKFNKHCKNVMNQAKSTVTRLNPLIGCHSTLNSTNKITLYKSCIRSLLTYNIHVWDDISNTNMKKLESFQNKCLRQYLKLRPHPISHRQVRTDTNMVFFFV